MQENFKVMSKDEFQSQMKKRDFIDFLNKTSRIVERALDNEFDVVGDFFKDDDEENQLKMLANKRDKVTQAFVF